jgi:hypothetical protein
MDQSIEQLRIESKVRIEEFRKQEEKRLQDEIAHANLENSVLWTRLINTSKLRDHQQQQEEDLLKEHQHPHNDNHVRFAEDQEQSRSTPTSSKRLSFALDESSINHLKHVNLDHYKDQQDSEGKKIDNFLVCIYVLLFR